MNIVELEHDIKKELRASMNGILSARMREAGMPFKLIFGVELPRLQSIAAAAERMLPGRSPLSGQSSQR